MVRKLSAILIALLFISNLYSFYVIKSFKNGNLNKTIKINVKSSSREQFIDRRELLSGVILPDTYVLTGEEIKIVEILNNKKTSKCTIITIANYGLRYFVLNWILSLKNNNYDKFVVLSLDTQLVEFLKEFNENAVLIPESWIQFDISLSQASSGSGQHLSIAHTKSQIIYRLLLFEQTVLYSDVDIVWLNRNIVEYIELDLESSYADIAYSQDFDTRRIKYNTGLIYATPTEFTKKLYKKLVDTQSSAPKLLDKWVLHNMLLEIKHSESQIKGLNKFIFVNGRYFRDNLYLKFNIKPFTAHIDGYRSQEMKISILKSYKLWFVPLDINNKSNNS